MRRRRYDGLIEELGGDPTPAVGFAIGIGRLIMAMEAIRGKTVWKEEADLYIGHIGDSAGKTASPAGIFAPFKRIPCRNRSDGTECEGADEICQQNRRAIHFNFGGYGDIAEGSRAKKYGGRLHDAGTV